ncbi:hypothetical protein BK668_03230 [Pseudomonas fluorescens]|nr:hypothetical protein BK668_03230 [Pseudomonas fluorescens]
MAESPLLESELDQTALQDSDKLLATYFELVFDLLEHFHKYGLRVAQKNARHPNNYRTCR